jgi:glycosyltransferase involved in cell wall biosynthesis
MLDILLIADRPGWAVERKADNLLRVLGSRHRLVKRFQDDVREEDLARADFVQVFFWMQFNKMGRLDEAFARVAPKVLLGVCSHASLAARRREPGIACLRRARAVFANNPRLRDETEAAIGSPVFLTPNGVDTTFFFPGEARRSPRRLRVGWAGSLANHGPQHRGFHDLIEPAVASIPDAELVAAIREEHWRGMEEMRAFYRSLDVYLCASRDEGTPNPCLEAAACGVPIVTTPVGNMPEFIRDGVNGFFVERDVADIRGKLLRLALDRGLRAAMGTAARRTAEAWDWVHMAEAYDEMYRSISCAQAG